MTKEDAAKVIVRAWELGIIQINPEAEIEFDTEKLLFHNLKKRLNTAMRTLKEGLSGIRKPRHSEAAAIRNRIARTL